MPAIQFQRYPAQTVANLWNRDQGLTDDASYFVATSPTAGTPIATTTSITTEDQTKPVFLLGNNWAAADPNAKAIYPLYLRLLLSQVPTSATDWQMSLILDQNLSKYTSGGSQLTPKNTNMGSGIASSALIYFGAVVAVTGSSQARRVARAQINSAVPVTKSQWLFTFGNSGVMSDVLNGGVAAANLSTPLPPINLQPQAWLAMQMWGTSNAAAPSWEVEFAYVER